MSRNKKIIVIFSCLISVLIIASIILCVVLFKEKTYDMTNITFTSQTIEYDGNEHMLTIQGELPKGVTVEYTENTLKDVGTINVTATFKGEHGYKEIPSLNASLTIIPKEITIKVNEVTSVIYELPKDNGYEIIDGTLNSSEIELLDLKVVIDNNVNYNKVGEYYNCLDLTYTENPNYIINVEKADYIVIDDNYYEVLFHYEDGTTEKVLVEKNSKIESIPTLPQKDGYIYEWKYNFDEIITSDMDIYMDIKLKDYLITYHLDGGVNNKNNVSTFTIEDEIILYDAEKEGYTFIGWFEEKECINQIEKIEKNTNKNIDLYAKFNPIQYKINYYIDNELVNTELTSYNATHTIMEMKNIDLNYDVIMWKYENIDILPLQEIEYNYKHDIDLYGVIAFVDHDFEFELVNGSAKIIGYRGNKKELVIPEYALIDSKYYNVNAIDEYAFDDVYYGLSIYIPSEILNVGDYAFSNCSEMTIYCENEQAVDGWSINWNYYNRPVYWNIKEEDIYRTNEFQYVLNHENKTAKLSRYIGTNISANIPSNLTINETEYKITSIGYSSFSNSSNLQTINMSNSIKSIESSSFINCFNLMSIEFSSNLINIGDRAFYNCLSLDNISLPNNINNIYEYTFANCSNLTNINLPEELIKISKGSFLNCESLILVDTKNNIQIIEDEAFLNCTNLREIVLGLTINTIGLNAFYNCNSLSKLSYNNLIDKWVSVNFQNEYANPMYYTKNIYVKDNDNYKLVENVELSSNVSCINSYSFYNCKSIRTLKIGIDVTQINRDAIINCDQLIIYCEYDSKPNGWDILWCDDSFIYYGVNSNNLIEKDNIQYIINREKSTATITKYLGTDFSLRIPSIITYENISYKVDEIGNKAFYESDTLNGIIITENIVKLGDYSFFNCKNLKFVYIPNNVKTFGDYVFSLTSNPHIYLQSFFSPNNNWYSSSSISNNYVIKNNCSSIYIDEEENIAYNLYEDTCTILRYYGNSTDYSIKSNITIFNETQNKYITYDVTVIGEKAFYDNNYIVNMTIPQNIRSIRNQAFESCNKLKYIDASNGVTYLGNDCFKDCSNLETVILSPNIEDYCENAFANCNNIKNLYYKGTIDNWLNNNFTESLSNPMNNVQKLYMYNDKEEFHEVTSIEIPEGIKEINYSIFHGCNAFVNLYLPSSIEKIYNGAFYNCQSLQNVYFRGTVDQWMDIEFINMSANPMVSAKHLYLYDDNNEFYELTTLEIPENKNTIKPYAFAGCDNLQNVYITEYTTSINASVFASCPNLKNVYFKGNVEKWLNINFEDAYSNPLSNSAKLYFYDENDQYYVVNNLLIDQPHIYKYAFYSCSSLEYIVVTKNVQIVYNNSFGNIPNLIIYCEMPWKYNSQYQLVGGEIYWNYTNNLYIYNNTHYLYDEKTMQASIVRYNGNEIELTIESTININGNVYTVNSIKNEAFADCTSIKKIIIPDTVSTIGSSCFSFCTSLEYVKLPNNLSSIGDYMFNNCTKLKSIVLPENVRSLGTASFNNCISLNEIDILGYISNFNDNVFDNCYNLNKITFAKTSSSLETKIFNYCNNLKIYLATSTDNNHEVLIGDYKNIYWNTKKYRFVIDDNYKYLIDIEKQTATILECLDVKEIMIMPSNIELDGENYIITRINVSVFQNNNELKYVVLPRYLDYINFGQFGGCINLVRVVMFENIKSIENAFNSCDKLIDICYPQNII